MSDRTHRDGRPDEGHGDDEPPDEGHLDEGRLLDLVDDRADAADRAHVETCGRCAGEWAALRVAAAAVAAPVPTPDPARRAAAIAAAAELHERLHREPAARTVGRRARTAPGRRVAWLGAVAAAVALVVGAAVAIDGDGADRDQVASQTSGDAGRELEAGADGAGQAGRSAADAAADDAAAGVATMLAAPADLGVLDEATLRDRVLERLAHAPAAAAPAPVPGGSAETGSTSGTGGGGSTDRGSAAPAVDACDGAVRAEDASLPPVALGALATWSGTPAVVLAYRLGDGRDVVVFVRAQAGCAPLHEDRFRTTS